MDPQDQYYEARIKEIQEAKERRQKIDIFIGESMLMLSGIALLIFIAPAIPWVIGLVLIYFALKSVVVLITTSIKNLLDFSDKSALALLDKMATILVIFILIIIVISYFSR